MSCYLFEGGILTDDNIIDFQDSLYDVGYNCDFDTMVYPIFYITVKISSSQYESLNDNTKVKMSLKVSNEDINFFSYIFQDKLFRIMDKNIGNEISNEDIYECVLYLILDEDIRLNENIKNGTLIDCDLNNALIFLFNGVEKNIFIEPTSNSKIYDQIILPPYNRFRNLRYLDEVYGVYSNGLQIFCDLDAIYCLNSYDNQLPKDNIMIKVIEDFSTKDDHLEKTINVLSNKISFNSPSSIQNQVTGDKNIVVIDTGDNLKNYSKQVSEDGNKLKAYYQKYTNPYKMKNLNKNKNIMSIETDDVDIRLLNCKNTYYVENNELTYEAYQIKNYFVKNGDTFNVHSSVLFENLN